MKRLFPILLAALLMGCKSNNEPLVIDFEYERLSPLMFRFTNLSSGFDEYRWDFGDGKWATGFDAYYDFETTGTYNVTLTGTINGTRYERTRKIIVSKPDVYIAGYTIYRIPYENRYYKLEFKDDALFPSSWDFTTSYTRMLDNDDMPYTVEFYNSYPMTDWENHTYYTVALIRTTNASNTSNDVQCMKQKLTAKQIATYQPEYLLQTESGASAVGVIMEYRY